MVHRWAIHFGRDVGGCFHDPVFVRGVSPDRLVSFYSFRSSCAVVFQLRCSLPLESGVAVTPFLGQKHVGRAAGEHRGLRRASAEHGRLHPRRSFHFVVEVDVIEDGSLLHGGISPRLPLSWREKPVEDDPAEVDAGRDDKHLLPTVFRLKINGTDAYQAPDIMGIMVSFGVFVIFVKLKYKSYFFKFSFCSLA